MTLRVPDKWTEFAHLRLTGQVTYGHIPGKLNLLNFAREVGFRVAHIYKIFDDAASIVVGELTPVSGAPYYGGMFKFTEMINR